jgi:hypothetical protein
MRDEPPVARRSNWASGARQWQFLAQKQKPASGEAGWRMRTLEANAPQ